MPKVVELFGGPLDGESVAAPDHADSYMPAAELFKHPSLGGMYRFREGLSKTPNEWWWEQNVIR